MPVIEWHERVYAIGVPVIDRQHRALLDLINDAHDVPPDVPGAALAPVLARMAAYAREHFAAEEELMRVHGFPHLERHCAEHDRFRAETERLCAAQDRGEELDPRAVFRFLGEWLSAHILELDSALGTHLGASPD